MLCNTVLCQLVLELFCDGKRMSNLLVSFSNIKIGIYSMVLSAIICQLPKKSGFYEACTHGSELGN